MDTSSPASRTAYGAARHRAVHQVAEDGVILRDPLAVTVLGEAHATLLARFDESPELVAWAAVRRERVAALGEPWISQFTPTAIAELLVWRGFDDVHLADAGATIRRVFGMPSAPASPRTRLALGARGWPVAAQAARS